MRNYKGALFFSKPIRAFIYKYWCEYNEANYAHGKNDFIAKLQIALKECYETEYWLELFVKSEIVDREIAKQLYNACGTIRKILISSINTAKSNKKKEENFYMNFLDAHKILHSYIDMWATYKIEDVPFYRISDLKNSKEEIFDAYKIFIAHMFILNTRAQEWHIKINSLVMMLGLFIDDKYADGYLQCQRVLQSKSIW